LDGNGKVSLPLEQNIWLEEGSEFETTTTTTRRFKEKQNELCEFFSQFLFDLNCWPQAIPKKIFDTIAEYSVPVGSDVRIA
jgi:hypothetical protein